MFDAVKKSPPKIRIELVGVDYIHDHLCFHRDPPPANVLNYLYEIIISVDCF